MSDPHDPFAAQPYIPPANRGSDTDVEESPPQPRTDEPGLDDREPTVVLPAESGDGAEGGAGDGDSQPPDRGRRRIAGALAIVVLAAGAGVGGAAAYDAIRGDEDTGVVSSLESDGDGGSARPGRSRRWPRRCCRP